MNAGTAGQDLSSKLMAIHGAPRSGTTWLGEIFNSSPSTLYRYQPLFSYAHKGALTPHSSRQSIQAFFHDLTTCTDDFTNQREKRQQGLLPEFGKTGTTHIVYKEVRYHHILRNLLTAHEGVLLIALIRNPMATINSWLKAPREFRSDLGWKEEEEWRYAERKNQGSAEEFNGFEKWKECATLFLDLETKFPTRCRVVTYAELLCRPLETVRSLFAFADLELTPQTESFLSFEGGREDGDPYSVNRRRIDDCDWKTQLDPEIAAAIRDDLSGTRLAQFLDAH